MTLEQLTALGATCACGALDFKGRNVGRLTADGPVISDEGQEWLEEHAPKAPRAKKGAKTKEPAKVEDDVSLGDLNQFTE